jgi:hypothetical protein
MDEWQCVMANAVVIVCLEMIGKYAISIELDLLRKYERQKNVVGVSENE